MFVLVDLAAHLGHDSLHLFLSLDRLEVVLFLPTLWLVVLRDLTVLDCFADLDKLVDAELSPDGVGVRDEVWRVVFEVGELRCGRERQERVQQCIGRISYVSYSWPVQSQHGEGDIAEAGRRVGRVRIGVSRPIHRSRVCRPSEM